jgi:hypothetical protein
MFGSTPAACGESVTTVVSRLIDACGCTCGSADEQLAPDRGTSILDEHGAIMPVILSKEAP